MAHDLILAMHIAVGIAGVVLGPFAIGGLVRGRTGRLASAYHQSVALVCVSAVGLAALDFAGLWWFVLIAAGSYAFAARAMLTIRSARPGWQARALRGFGGAYIALWTAILVVSVPDQPVAWAIPTVLGSLAVERLAVLIGRRVEPASENAITG